MDTIRDLYGQWFDASFAAQPAGPFVFSALILDEGEDGESYWRSGEDGSGGLAVFDPVSGRVLLQDCVRFPELTVVMDRAGTAVLTAGSTVLRRMDVDSYPKSGSPVHVYPESDPCNVQMINKPQDG